MENLSLNDPAAAAIAAPVDAVTQPKPVVENEEKQRQLPAKFSHATLEDVRQLMATFATERNWEQHHTPRNLMLALTGEVGELAECFQWKGDNTSVDDWPEAERVHLGEELSDVALYLVRLADRCNIDLAAAIQDKMVKNRRKYPAHLVNGSSAKYTAYTNDVEGLSTTDTSDKSTEASS